MSELKPCPFCGEDNLMVLQRSGAGIYGPRLQCGTCNTIRLMVADEPSPAIDEWNHRPVEDALRAELEAMKKATDAWMDLAEARQAELTKVRAELERERARLDWALEALTTPRENQEQGWLYSGHRPGHYGYTKIPAGQTARDVIDRLIKESKP